MRCKNKIKEIKIKYKKERQKIEKEYVTNEKINTKKTLLNNKEKKATILKNFIENNIKKFNEKYKREEIIKIYQHAFSYDHQNIEKELRDRIKIKE
jgi:predicted RND superfamily exporter protein